MTLGELSERILRIYYGGNIPDENGIQQEDMQGLIAAAANSITKKDLWANMAMDGRFIDPLFISTYENVPIQFNENRNLYYIDFPTSPMNLNRGLGIYQISPMKGQEGSFIPVRTGWSSLYSGLVAGYLQGHIAVELEGKKGYFVANIEPIKEGKLKLVLLKMVQNIKDINPDDELPMPEDYYKDIIDYCLARIQNEPTPDDENNRIYERK